MKLKQNREHYRAVGLTWVPKRPFNSDSQARKAGYHISNWRCYQCTFCNKYHVAKRSKSDNR